MILYLNRLKVRPVDNTKFPQIDLQEATFGPLKEFLQGFVTYKENDTLFTQGIVCNISMLTGCGCVLVHPALHYK